jgi:hypothetical protein
MKRFLASCFECDFTRIECVDNVLITRQEIFKYNGR